MVKLKHIAHKAGVSISAVSRAYTQGASVAPHTRKIIEQTARNLGYHREMPSPPSKNNVNISERSHSDYLDIGFIVHPSLKGMIIEFLEALPDKDDQRPIRWSWNRAGNHGTLILGGTTNWAQMQLAPPLTKAQNNLNAVHCIPERIDSDPTPSLLSCININYQRAGQQAAEILLAGGFETIGFLGTEQHHLPSTQCYQGFSAILDHTFQLDWQYHQAEENTVEAAFQIMCSQISTNNHASAYFCSSEKLALGLIQALHSRGLGYPKDCAILGLGNHPSLSWLPQPISSLSFSNSVMINTAMTLIKHQMNNPDASPEHPMLHCRLTDRGSLCN